MFIDDIDVLDMGGSPLSAIENEHQLFPEIPDRDGPQGFDAIPLQDDLLGIGGGSDRDNARSRGSSSETSSESGERFRKSLQGNIVMSEPPGFEDSNGFQAYPPHTHHINPKKQKLHGRGLNSFSVSANSAFETRYHPRSSTSQQHGLDSKESVWSSPASSRSSNFHDHLRTPSENSDDSNSRSALLWGSLEHLDANWNSPSTSLSVAPGTDTPDISTTGEVTTISGSSDDDDSDIDVVSIVDEGEAPPGSSTPGSERSKRNFPSNSESIEILDEENIPGPSGLCNRRDSPLEVLSSSSDSSSDDEVEVMDSSPMELPKPGLHKRKSTANLPLVVDLTESDDGKLEVIK